MARDAFFSSIFSPSLLFLNYPWIGTTVWETEDNTPVGESGICLTEKVTLWSLGCWLSCTMHRIQTIYYFPFCSFPFSLPWFSWDLENCNLSQPCYGRLIKNLTSANSLDWCQTNYDFTAHHLQKPDTSYLHPPPVATLGFFSWKLHSNRKGNKDTSLPCCSLPLPCPREKGAY